MITNINHIYNWILGMGLDDHVPCELDVTLDDVEGGDGVE
jgi:hypothetical protein